MVLQHGIHRVLAPASISVDLVHSVDVLLHAYRMDIHVQFHANLLSFDDRGYMQSLLF